jgi:glycerol-3-phosphate cytidylyltransferase
VVVGISTDEFNALKGKDTIIPYEERARIVGALKYVDRVFPEYSWDQKRADIAREQAAVFAMGDDWVGAFDDLADCCEVLYVPRTKDVSTANLKTALVQHIVASRINEIAMASQRLISLIGDLRDVSAGTSGPVRDPAHIRWPFGKGAGH